MIVAYDGVMVVFMVFMVQVSNGYGPRFNGTGVIVGFRVYKLSDSYLWFVRKP